MFFSGRHLEKRETHLEMKDVKAEKIVKEEDVVALSMIRKINTVQAAGQNKNPFGFTSSITQQQQQHTHTTHTHTHTHTNDKRERVK